MSSWDLSAGDSDGDFDSGIVENVYDLSISDAIDALTSGGMRNAIDFGSLPIIFFVFLVYSVADSSVVDSIQVDVSSQKPARSPQSKDDFHLHVLPESVGKSVLWSRR